jgi:hypothetical protein
MSEARCNWLVRAALSLVLLTPGCAKPPGAAPIVGPDGTHMLHVHCAGEQAACFQIAGDRCPRGYDLSPILDPHDGNFLVRCREQLVSSVVISSRPVAPNHNPAATVSDRWPPAEVATPSEPWPTNAASEPPPAPRNESGAVDIGY